MGSKFKLSDTMQFFTGKLNAITGGEVELIVDVDDPKVKAGEELRARAVVRSPDKNRRIDFILISLKGQVQREEKWQDYVQSAEVAHDNALPADHEFVVPIVIRVPLDAVLTEDGGNWSIFARAHIDKSLDPRAESSFVVLHGDS